MHHERVKKVEKSAFLLAVLGYGANTLAVK